MHANDPADRVQPEAQSASWSLGSKERLEDAPLQLNGNAGTVVPDLDQQHIPGGADEKPDFPLILNRVQGVFDQCGPDLVELAAVRAYRRQVGLVVADHFHLAQTGS